MVGVRDVLSLVALEDPRLKNCDSREPIKSTLAKFGFDRVLFLSQRSTAA